MGKVHTRWSKQSEQLLKAFCKATACYDSIAAHTCSIASAITGCPAMQPQISLAAAPSSVLHQHTYDGASGVTKMQCNSLLVFPSICWFCCKAYATEDKPARLWSSKHNVPSWAVEDRAHYRLILRFCFTNFSAFICLICLYQVRSCFACMHLSPFAEFSQPYGSKK